MVFAGAVGAAEPPPSPTPALTACQTKGKAGMPNQACVDAPGFDTAAGRRQRLRLDAQRDCRVLESAILESEQAERRMRAAMIESIQQDLLILRKRFRKLGC